MKHLLLKQEKKVHIGHPLVFFIELSTSLALFAYPPSNGPWAGLITTLLSTHFFYLPPNTFGPSSLLSVYTSFYLVLDF
jgi:hypothetical protein